MALSGLASERNDLKSVFFRLEKTHAEVPNDLILYYRLYALVDGYYEYPKVALRSYEEYRQNFGTDDHIFRGMTEKRIKELREQILFSED
jgi:hypothetical protein